MTGGDICAPGLVAALGGVLPAEVGLGAADPGAPPRGLWAGEDRAVTHALPRRQREFAAGRRAARRALGVIGAAPAAILMGADRAPVWPDGITGSISHCAGACLALAARVTPRIGALGLDVETAEPLDPGLWAEVLDADERTRLGPAPGETAKALFSAKEAAYKAQYTHTATFLDFSAMTVRLSDHGPDGRARRFTARLCRDAGPLTRGTVLTGCQVWADGLIASLVLSDAGPER